MTMNIRSTKIVVTAIVVALFASAGAIAARAAVGDSHHTPAPASPRAAGFARHAAAQVAAASRNARPVAVFAGSRLRTSVVSSAGGRCLIRAGKRARGETCASLAELDSGLAISVNDECGSAGENRMAISGLVPEGVRGARLQLSDESTEPVATQAGAFLFEGFNPTGTQAYPVDVQWLDEEGHQMGTASLPVRGDEFCIPTPEAPASP